MTADRPSLLNELARLALDKAALRYSALRSEDSSANAAGKTSSGDSIDFVVVEGPYSYYLASDCAGWGSVVGNFTTATVRAIKTLASTGARLVLGEAEVRTNVLRPAYNAELYVQAAMALVHQGCLQRAGVQLAGAPVFRLPHRSKWTDVQRFSRRVVRGVMVRIRRIRKQWNIGVLPVGAVKTDKPFPWSAVKWVDPLPDGFIADPFLVRDGDKLWLFYEQLLYAENQGTLWVGRFDPATASLTERREVLRTKFHLSFPNVFKLDGVWYMFPEEGRSGATMLYRAKSFPDQWEPHHVVLKDFPGIDPVLWNHGGKWWLFVSHGAAPCSDNNLFLFHADSVEGEWHPHPMNPIKTGLYGSRMAGPITLDAGKLLRPGQDCREGYGMGLVLNEIVELTPQSYVEREVIAWPPQPGGAYGIGFHHFMQCGDALMIDGQRPQRLR